MGKHGKRAGLSMDVRSRGRRDLSMETGTYKSQERSEPSDNPLPELVLRTTGLRRSFGKVRAVDGLDLTVRAGEIYGFLGRNGAGKTTTIRMLMGIIKPESGTIGLLGTTASRTTIDQKRRIGYVSQEPAFYPWMSARKLGKFVGGLYPTWAA
jgi:ABC-2 type transport system ATP-binding protein